MAKENLITIVLHFNDGRNLDEWQESLLVPEIPKQGDYIVWTDNNLSGQIIEKKYIINRIEYKTLMFNKKWEDKAQLGRIDAYLNRIKGK